MSPKFIYEAVRADGSKNDGTAEAADRYALARQLRSEGLTVVKVTSAEVAARRGGLGRFWRNFAGRVSIKEKIIFASSLGAMVGAGLTLSRALDVVGRQSSSKRFRQIVGEISERVQKGSSLHEALAAAGNIFPPVFTAMVAAGEESGKLPQSLEVVRQQLAKSYDLRRKIRGAMIYPAVIVSVIIVIGILMMIFLVPNLSALFRDLKVELPLSTRLVIGTSDFLANHLWLFLLGLAVAIAAAVKFSRSLTGQRLATRVWMHLPAIRTIIKNYNAAVTMRTISSLISSGVSMIESLKITQEVLQNLYYREVLGTALESIQKGGTLSQTFKQHEDIFPVLVGEMTEVGEETGNLSGMLLKGAVFFEEDVDQATKNLSTVIEPALMILIGIFVGFFAVSMLGPMYSLSDAI